MTPEELKALEELDNETVPTEPEKPKKVKAPENENPMLTKALAPFRAKIGKPEKGTEKLVTAVIHKRQFDADGILISKPFIQYFDDREYKNFLNHPSGFTVELEIHNPFK